MSSGTTVEFFVDCSSQWTKLAFHNIRAMSRDLGFKIEWKPILLGAVAEVAAAVGAHSGAVRPASDLGHRVFKVADCDARQPSRSAFDHQQTSVCKRDRAFGKAKHRCDFLRWLVSLYLFTYFKPFPVVRRRQLTRKGGVINKVFALCQPKIEMSPFVQSRNVP